MRLSVMRNDPGFDLELSMVAQVLVDGVDVTSRCFTADEELGEAKCYRLDEFGRYFDAPAVETLRGRVEIVLPKRVGGAQ